MKLFRKNTCRTCLRVKTSNIKNVYHVIEMLRLCTSVDIEQSDTMPKGICNACYSKLEVCLSFRKQCEKSENILKDCVKKNIPLINYSTFESSEKLDKNKSVKKPVLQDVSDNISNYVLQNCKEEKIEPKEELDNCIEDDTEYLSDISEKKYKDEEHVNANSSIEVIIIKQEPADENAPANDVKLNEKQNTKSTNKRLQKSKNKGVRKSVKLLRHSRVNQRLLLNQPDKFRCDLCGRECTSKRQLQQHKSIHKRSGAHLCSTCGKQFTLPENLVRHERIHTGDHPYSCPICPNKTFAQSNQLKSHLVTHSQLKPHLCSTCGKEFARYRSLRVHILRMHPLPGTSRQFPCEICAKVFKDRRDLAQHIAIHTKARQFVCGVCKKAFNRRNNLRVHEYIHTGYRPHACSVCNRAFIQKHVLDSHMKTHKS